MIAFVDSVSSSESPGQASPHPPSWHATFLEFVPSIRRYAQLRFRYLKLSEREEAVQEVIARALVEFVRLVERGRQDLAYASPLARHAVAHVRHGRRVGGSLNGSDVSSEYCQRRRGLVLESLSGESDEHWQEVLVEDRASTPADIAAARIDVSEWLGSLPQRNRQLAKRLALGESTSNAARMFGVSPARVSQMRRELFYAWQLFQNLTSQIAGEHC